ncbi:PaaX family transcriptional regulator [Streptomyces sp. WMMC500]|uniref:PaaX family transcriptional regulator n=1 Tax=Streptomyces sp. WMMC500 TaxID=3015154 RepID=UPI00248C9F78|nr:PaaX family transcriptional regulator C-terminal domain-containing protein [Streptomyces sp. WMMC500]WBB62312.1 PaaX family transcriptional regulator [Streptomyces sp. WMMC500]
MAAERTPRSLIVSFYGAFGRGAGPGAGSARVPVAALIRLLGAVGVDAPAVRSAVSRLKRRGLLLPVRHEGEAAYALSPAARTLLDDGDRRIYRREAPAGPGDWLLAVFSVPESERRKRHLLRSRLARLGFGQAAPGVWIAPAHVAEETRHTLRRLELAPYVDLFRGTHEGFTPTRESVARWWDLPATAKLHEAFLDAHEPVLRRWSAPAAAGQDAYRDYLLALDAWRHLPYADPGLPPEVLPPDWPGGRAAEVFAALDDLLRAPADGYVAAELAGAARR